jgi:hypothetical protein
VRTVDNAQLLRCRRSSSAAQNTKKSARQQPIKQETDKDRQVIVPRPTGILQRGNSDPFSAWRVTIDASANDVLTFGRECFLPALYNRDAIRGSLTAFRIYEDLIDEGAASALISFYATTLAVVSKNPKDRALALTYQTDSITRLRLRVTTEYEYAGIIAQVLRLFCCDILTRNLKAAKVHASLLRKLFELSAGDAVLDVPTLSVALYHDLNLSAMFMARSSFDLDKWVPEIFKQYWAIILDPYLSECPQTQLDPSIGNLGALKDMIDNVQKHLYLTTTKRAKTQSPQVMFWFVNWSTILQARLINHYLDLFERTGSSKISLWEEARITLAALYLDHSLRPRPSIQGIVLFETLTTILNHLQNAIEQGEKTNLRSRPGNSLLWALFVGAQAERSKAVPSSTTWFTVRFRRCAFEMGLSKWKHVEEIVKGFPYSADMKPCGQDWIDELLKVTYGVDGKVINIKLN